MTTLHCDHDSILSLVRATRKFAKRSCLISCISYSHYRFLSNLEMSELLRHSLGKFTFSPNGAPTRRGIVVTPKYRHLRPFQCVYTQDNRSIVVKNGNDSLDICRVVNGMWQTSGGWGRIDRNDAVDAMLKYADAGLTTFDMADICMQLN